ncbi:LCP family protein [Pontimonas sp.]|uniref:LCP family protein n=1 Tax=Pontimonas sp. TaxID=2304492 RepID=UPI0028706A33|nr:LCP family protein [Pontimonas sp.]MDR9396549.1 LCP family protein [Pontimonas sp.]
MSTQGISRRERRRRRGWYQPHHATQKRLGGWRAGAAIAGLVTTSLVVSAFAVAGFTVANLTASLQTVELPGYEQPVMAGVGEWEGGFNVLIVGSDTRVGQGEQFGESDSELNDVNLLVHVSENHDHATVMSFPRDTLVDVPACEQADGSLSEPRELTPLNATWSIGGLPCVAATVEQLTGLDVGYAGVMTFTGVAQLSTAVGGVEVCVNEPIVDPWSGLDLPEAGWHTLEGGQALAFLRTRKGVGDGSDLARISSQQVYMSALVRTLQADGVLNDVTRLYGIAQVAAQNMVLSSSLGSLDVMVSMARALRNIPNENIVFIQFPVLDAPEGYSGKVIPDPTLSETVLAKIQTDEPYALAEGSGGRGSEDAPAEEGVDAEVPSASADEGQEPTDQTGEAQAPDTNEADTTEEESGGTGEETPADQSDGDTSSEDAEQESDQPVTQAEVLEGLVGQTADDVTCAVAN